MQGLCCNNIVLYRALQMRSISLNTVYFADLGWGRGADGEGVGVTRRGKQPLDYC